MMKNESPFLATQIYNLSKQETIINRKVNEISIKKHKERVNSNLSH